MKILLIGPGYGHNIQPFLKFFNGNDKCEVDFFYNAKNEFENDFKKIKFFSLFLQFWKLPFKVKNYDVIWLMGGGKFIYMLAILLLLKKRNCKAILHIWGEKLPRLIMKNSYLGRLTNIAAAQFSIINCNWYGTAELIQGKLKGKVQVNILGLTKGYFQNPDNPDKEIFQLLDNVSDDTYNFYYPKSFNSSSRHDLVVEAVKILKEDKKIPFHKVYFIEGNIAEKKRKDEIIKLISSYNLEEVIQILPKKKFFEVEEFNLLWTKMHCGLQIAEHDQFSNTVLEPLINHKDLIISDIYPYRRIEEYLGFELSLTSLNALDISVAMKSKILGINVIDEFQKNEIKKLIKQNYSFEINFQKLVNKLETNN